MPLPQKWRASWIAEFLAATAVASGVGYLLAAYTVSRWLTRPSRGRPRPTPAELKLPWEEVECRTSDGMRLVGWVVNPPRARGTVALFHGLRQNRSQALPRIALLAAAGFRCVAFDHRAHGQSAGRHASFGYWESRDVEAVLDFIGHRWGNERCAALGISMGAAAICFASRRAKGLDACILESLYHDIASAFDNRIGSKFPRWFRRFMRGTIWVTERRLGAKLSQVTPANHIGALNPAPVLLLCGSNDIHAPPTDAQRLFLRCGEPRELVQIEGADHTNLCTKDQAKYGRVVLSFLHKHMARGGAKLAA